MAQFTPQKILIDTDPGQDIDDLLAILFALLRPELEVVGITTVTWPAEMRERLVRRLLRYLGRSDVPVAAGMALPLRKLGADEFGKQQDLERSMNHRCFAEPEDPLDAPRGEDAVDLIIRTVEAHPGEVVLACIGPLTNIACALRKRPEIVGKIKYIAMMGGEVAQDRAEHNVAFDYVASEIVFTSGVPIYMGTWSVTREFTLTMEDCAFFHQHPAPVLRALGEAISQWYPAQSWKPGPVMYDIFPIIWAFNRELYTTEPMAVEVETQDPAARGKTVLRGEAATMAVTTGVDAAAVRKLYLETLEKLG